MKMKYCSVVLAALLLGGCSGDTTTDTPVTQTQQSISVEEQIDTLAKSVSREEFASQAITVYKEDFMSEYAQPVYDAQIVKDYLADYGLGYTVDDISSAINGYVTVESIENNAALRAQLEAYYDSVQADNQNAVRGPQRVASTETLNLLDELLDSLYIAFSNLLKTWFDDSFIGDLLSLFFDFSIDNPSDGTEPTPEPTNTAPTASSQSVSVEQNTQTEITLSGDDSDGDDLSYVVNQPTHGVVSGTAPVLTYTPASNYTGSDSFTFKVDDGTVDSAFVTVSIDVTASTPNNTAPTSSAQTLSLVKNTQKNITLAASDSDDDMLTYSVQSPSNGVLSGTAPNLTYTPNEGYDGSDSFSFSVNDGAVDSNTAIVTITVTNNAPTAVSQSISLEQDTQKDITLGGSDLNGDALTYIAGEPSHGVLSGTAPNFTYIPEASYAGSDSFSYKVNDGSVDSSTVTVSIDVVAVEQMPDPASYKLNELSGQVLYVKSGVTDMTVTMNEDSSTGKGLMGFLSMSFSYTGNLIETSMMGDYDINFTYIDEGYCVAADAIDDDGTVYESYWFSSESVESQASSLSEAKTLCHINAQ